MNNDHIQQLAEQFISLWQRQLAQVARDGDFMQSMFATMQQFGTPHAQSKPQHAAADANDDGLRGDELDFRLRQMDERLAELERAVARLESQIATGSAGKAASRARRNPTKKRR